MSRSAFYKAAVLVVLTLAVATTAVWSDVLTVKNNKVGINQPDPTYILHIRRDDGMGAGFRVQTENAPASLNWYFQQNHVTGAFLITPFNGGSAPVQVFPGDAATIQSTLCIRDGRVGIKTQTPQGALHVNGSIVQRGETLHPDYVFDASYKLETIEEHAAYMYEKKHLPAVGPGKYDADGAAILDLGQRSQGTLEELEKAHIYIAELNKTLNRVVERLDRKDAVIEDLRRQVAALQADKAGKD